MVNDDLEHLVALAETIAADLHQRARLLDRCAAEILEASYAPGTDEPLNAAAIVQGEVLAVVADYLLPATDALKLIRGKARDLEWAGGSASAAVLNSEKGSCSELRIG